MKVLAAMSGGVDSAVAAARAVEAGHQVVAVHMALMKNRQAERMGNRGCCSLEDASDARRAANMLGIPFYVWDLAEEFERTVVSDFLAEYEAGRTPNPCVRCNEHVKFAELMTRAEKLGFDAVCTGHYARIRHGADGVELHRAVYGPKDQSYVLAVMGPDKLAHALFPLGDAPSKDAIRAEAGARGLPVSEKPDSYDICFVADGDTRGFLRRALGERPGKIVDQHGEPVGEHTGAYQFTVGQRRGVGLSRPAADGRPRYVLGTRPASNEVIVGPAELLGVRAITTEAITWYGGGRRACEAGPVSVQLRAHGAALPATIEVHDDATITAHLDTPARGVAGGQSLVIFDGTRVLGEATIASVTHQRPRPTPTPAAAH